MAGHSKWNNIKNKKEKTDFARAKIFTKIGREMAVSIKEGGPDPEQNSKLKDIIAKAKSFNVPNDNIDRIIKKASDKDSSNYDSITYEGYGPSGVAVIVSTLTDNRNRTAGEMRHYFDKNGGNLGLAGSVTFMFEQKGIIVIENDGLDEEKVMNDCIEAGAEDFEISSEAVEITTEPADLLSVRRHLEEVGYVFASAELEYLPSTVVELGEEDTIKMNKLIDMLEENDDVQNIWHNWKLEE